MVILFWKYGSKPGIYASGSKGLTQEQIEELRKLEPGDRLCLIRNQYEDSNYEYKLSRLEPRGEE